MQRKTVSSLNGGKNQRKEATVNNFPKYTTEGLELSIHSCIINTCLKFILGLYIWGGKRYLRCMDVYNAFLNGSLRAGRHCCKALPQNLRNIWIVQVFFISLINVSLKYCFGLSRKW